MAAEWTADDFSGITPDALLNAGSWQNQYRLLMNWARLVQTKPALRQERHRIKGCAAPAWLAYDNDYWYFDSDSQIIKGLGALLLSTQASVESRQPPSIEDLQILLQQTGLSRHLTPSRNNGLRALIARMRDLAINQLPS